MIRILLPLLLGLSSAQAKDPPPVRVTIVVVLANSESTEIHPKLTDLAKEVQKRDEDLTGFKLDSVLQESIPVGSTHTFAIVEKKEVKITVVKPKDNQGRISLKLLPPGLEEITYSCTCEKFFPVITPVKTKSGEQIIIAVMAKPCNGKGP